MNADFSAQKIEEEGSSDKNSNNALKEMTHKEICGISENLRRDNRNGQQPSPMTALEPAQGSNREQRAQNEERNSYEFAERREMLIGARVQPPDSIESRALPRQGYPGQQGHQGAEQKEQADGSNACVRLCGVV
jgi:hypothetical protein